jgi:hypothetical protein
MRYIFHHKPSVVLLHHGTLPGLHEMPLGPLDSSIFMSFFVELTGPPTTSAGFF